MTDRIGRGRHGLRIFKTKWFIRFARKQGIEDTELREAINRVESGIVDADLGGGVIKQRIARTGEGKSGGFRSIVLFRSGDKAFFVFGYAKSARDNIRADELRGFKLLAAEMLNHDEAAITKALETGALQEVTSDDQDISE